MKVAFQGETGAFSEEASLALFPESQPVPNPTFEAVFEAVSDGSSDRGVIPIENSLHGSVHQNYDLLREHALIITDEIQLRIRHYLLTVRGSNLENIRAVYSHPQALGQCRDFLRSTLAGVEIISSYDTAGAAKMVAEKNDPQCAAIAGAVAGTEYCLITLAANIESNHQNYTRFLALARSEDERPRAQERDVPMKTSIVYAQQDNVPGSLFKSLAVFALRDIDLFKIESRPLVGSPGKYLFYLDLAGSMSEEPVQNALRHLEEVAASVKILGTYAVGSIMDG